MTWGPVTVKSSLNPDLKGEESWGGVLYPPKKCDSDSFLPVSGFPEPWVEQESEGPSLCSPEPLPQFPCSAIRIKTVTFPSSGMPWEKMADAVSGSGHEVVAVVGAGAGVGDGGSCVLLCIFCQPGLA